jgi:hypothetical protein
MAALSRYVDGWVGARIQYSNTPFEGVIRGCRRAESERRSGGAGYIEREPSRNSVLSSQTLTSTGLPC